LHGGNVGFDKCLWSGEIVEEGSHEGSSRVAVKFFILSPDGEEGFPGQVAAAVTYSLAADDTLRLEYEATTSRTTPIAMTNHTYWNLSGECRENILAHSLSMPASQYLPVDANSIPTGILAVENTPFDFRVARTIGERIGEIGGEPGGYDHCYVNQVDGVESVEGVEGGSRLSSVAKVECISSGRTMQVFSDQKGVQLYTGNFLDGEGCHTKHGALCLETQAFPDAVNQWPEQVILQPGETWKSTTMHAFGVTR
jgi:aldose 1-epimerase